MFFVGSVLTGQKTQYTSQFLNGSFVEFLAQFSLYTSVFRGAARPGKAKSENEQERQIIHIVDWCENITTCVIQVRASSDFMIS